MSRFIFTSLGARNDSVHEKLKDKLDTSKRILIIPCAASNEELTAKVEKAALCRLGFEPDNVFSFDASEPERYRGIFFDYIYVTGGNQYKLLSEIRQYHIDINIILPCIEKGAVYVGISAGAYIAVRDMRYSLLLEPDDKFPLDDYTALGLVEHNIICHFDHYGQDDYERVKKASHGKRIITVDDDSVIEI